MVHHTNGRVNIPARPAGNSHRGPEGTAPTDSQTSGDGPGRETDGRPIEGSDFDRDVDQLLCSIRSAPSWGPAKVSAFVGELLDFLADFPYPCGFPPQEWTDGVFEQLRARLKSHKHHSPTVAALTKQFRALVGSADHPGGPGRPAAGGGTVSYEAVTGTEEDAPADPAETGFYRNQGGHSRQLTNFTIELNQRVRVLDDVTPTTRFEGLLSIGGREEPFGVDVATYSNDTKLLAAVYEAAGSGAQVHGKMADVRNAIGSFGRPAEVTVTTRFGWDESGTRFLVPDGVVTADGFQPHAAGGPTRVDLSAAGIARHLGFRPLPAGELAAAKRHLAEDLLHLHDRRVTFSLWGMAALAVLYRHTTGVGRFALWLKGLTGAGKSFTAKLFANLFGDFPVNSGRFANWASTPNFLQNQGYYFRDSLMLVDDFKLDVTRNHLVVGLLQAYADNTARGRLNASATANPTREIRGMLVSTAEDLPEHSASTLGRLVAVTVPQRAKDVERGQRCLRQSAGYSGVMADFVRFALARGWTGRFAADALALQQQLLSGVAGRQNDARVTSNLALLGTALRAACEYLADAWPEGPDQAAAFVASDLRALRDEMLAGAREQQASEVFLQTLAGLIEHRRVRIESWARYEESSRHAPVIGRVAPPTGRGTVFVLCTSLCLEHVNTSLRAQGRPPVAASVKALLDQLDADEKLIHPPEAQAARAPRGGRRTTQVSLGIGNRRGFLIAESVLLNGGQGE